MRILSNLAEILASIKIKTQDTLNNEIADKIKETEVKKAEEDVYSVYSPKVYKRSYGLKNIDYMDVSQYGEVGIEVSNNEGHADIVESGDGYQYDFEYNGVPRPFQQNTIDELMENGEINKMLINGLRKRGIKTK